MTDSRHINYQSYSEWPFDELIALEDHLRSMWAPEVDGSIDFADIAAGDPSDGFGAAPALAAWLEDHLTAIDRVLSGAGFRMVYRLGRWQRTSHKIRLIEDVRS